MIDQKDIQDAIAKEIAKFLEENRPEIIRRALAKLRAEKKEADVSET